MTVACARCHDHKFDPIPTKDYYGLQGVFASVSQVPRPLAEVEPEVETRFMAAEQRLFYLSYAANLLRGDPGSKPKEAREKVEQFRRGDGPHQGGDVVPEGRASGDVRPAGSVGPAAAALSGRRSRRRPRRRRSPRRRGAGAAAGAAAPVPARPARCGVGGGRRGGRGAIDRAVLPGRVRRRHVHQRHRRGLHDDRHQARRSPRHARAARRQRRPARRRGRRGGSSRSSPKTIRRFTRGRAGGNWARRSSPTAPRWRRG